MTRYKIGDKVRVINYKNEWSYWVPDMNYFVGKVGEVIDYEYLFDGIFAIVNFSVSSHPSRYFFPDEVLELVDDQDDRVSPTMTVFDFFKREEP